jgi:hypothetical protein
MYFSSLAFAVAPPPATISGLPRAPNGSFHLVRQLLVGLFDRLLSSWHCSQMGRKSTEGHKA